MRRIVMDESAEQRQNRLGLAGLRAICDTAQAFVLLAAACIIEGRDDDDRKRRAFVSELALEIEAGHPAKVDIEQQSDRRRLRRRREELLSGRVGGGGVSPG